MTNKEFGHMKICIGIVSAFAVIGFPFAVFDLLEFIGITGAIGDILFYASIVAVIGVVGIGIYVPLSKLKG